MQVHSKIPLISHLISGNPDNPALKESSLKTIVLLFNTKKIFINKICISQRHVHKMCARAVLSPDPLSPIQSISSAMKNQENTEEGPDNPQPADEGDIKMEYTSD